MAQKSRIPVELYKLINFCPLLKNLEPFIEASKIARDNNIQVILNPGMLIIDQGFDNIRTLLEKIDIFILSEREFTTIFKINSQALTERIVKEKTNALKVKESSIKIKLEIAKLQSDIIKHSGNASEAINEKSGGKVSMSDFKAVRKMIEDKSNGDNEDEIKD